VLHFAWGGCCPVSPSGRMCRLERQETGGPSLISNLPLPSSGREGACKAEADATTSSRLAPAFLGRGGTSTLLRGRAAILSGGRHRVAAAAFPRW